MDWRKCMLARKQLVSQLVSIRTSLFSTWRLTTYIRTIGSGNARYMLFILINS